MPPEEDEIYDADGNRIHATHANKFHDVMEAARQSGQTVLDLIEANPNADVTPTQVTRNMAELVVQLADQNIRTYESTLLGSYSMVAEAWKTGLSAGVDYANNQTYSDDLPPNPYYDENIERIIAQRAQEQE